LPDAIATVCGWLRWTAASTLTAVRSTPTAAAQRHILSRDDARRRAAAQPDNAIDMENTMIPVPQRDDPRLEPQRSARSRHDEWLIDEAIRDSFPASDPASTSQPGSLVSDRYADFTQWALASAPLG
jgi:hypothetical protein